MSIFGLTLAHSVFNVLSNKLFFITQKIGATGKKDFRLGISNKKYTIKKN